MNLKDNKEPFLGELLNLLLKIGNKPEKIFSILIVKIKRDSIKTANDKQTPIIIMLGLIFKHLNKNLRFKVKREEKSYLN